MLLLRLLSLIPLRALYLFSDFLFVISFYVLRYRRALVEDNLKRSFPEKTDEERRVIGRKFFRNLCDFSVETLKLLTIDKQELVDRMVYVNPDALRPYKDRSQSVLLLASHQFNWEWLLAAGSIELPMQVDFVYQPQRSTLANRFSMAIRTRFGAHPIQRETVGREALRRKDIVRGTAIVADQFPGHFNHRRYWTNFMGQKTAFFHGIAQLAALTQSPVFFGAITKTARGRYELKLEKIADPPYTEESSVKMIDSYVTSTERIIRSQPEGWLWSHNRWKQLDEA